MARTACVVVALACSSWPIVLPWRDRSNLHHHTPGLNEVFAHVESIASVVLWAGADQDVIIVNGATSLDSIGFVEGTLNQEVVA